MLAGQGGDSVGFRRRGPSEAMNSATPTRKWGELPRASGFRGRRVGFLRGSGLNSADRKRRARIRIRGVRTSRLLISRFKFESRSLASIPTVSERQLRRNNRERDRAFVELTP